MGRCWRRGEAFAFAFAKFDFKHSDGEASEAILFKALAELAEGGDVGLLEWKQQR